MSSPRRLTPCWLSCCSRSRVFVPQRPRGLTPPARLDRVSRSRPRCSWRWSSGAAARSRSSLIVVVGRGGRDLDAGGQVARSSRRRSSRSAPSPTTPPTAGPSLMAWLEQRADPGRRLGDRDRVGRQVRERLGVRLERVRRGHGRGRALAPGVVRRGGAAGDPRRGDARGGGPAPCRRRAPAHRPRAARRRGPPHRRGPRAGRRRRPPARHQARRGARGHRAHPPGQRLGARRARRASRRAPAARRAHHADGAGARPRWTHLADRLVLGVGAHGRREGQRRARCRYRRPSSSSPTASSRKG